MKSMRSRSNLERSCLCYPAVVWRIGPCDNRLPINGNIRIVLGIGGGLRHSGRPLFFLLKKLLHKVQYEISNKLGMSNHKKYFIFVQQNSRLTTLLNKGANEETIVGNEAAMQSSWTTENRCYFWRLHETNQWQYKSISVFIWDGW